MLRTTHQDGATLIELLIAISVAIVLLVVAIPMFISMYQEFVLNTYTENLYYVLQYARSAAIKNNQSVYVNFYSSDSWCYGVNAGSTCNCQVANSCGLGTYSAPRAQDMTLSTTGLTNNTLIFDGTHGSATVSTISFTNYGGANSIEVSIGALGNMHICSNQLSGYGSCP